MLERELFGASACQQHVRGALHHHPGQVDRVADVPESRDSARAQRRAIHHRGIELVHALAVEHGAAPGVEQRRVLQDLHRDNGRVHAGAAVGEHGVAGIERPREVIAIGLLRCCAQRGAIDDAGAAMDGDRDHGAVSQGRGGHEQGEAECGKRRTQHDLATPRSCRRGGPRAGRWSGGYYPVSRQHRVRKCAGRAAGKSLESS